MSIVSEIINHFGGKLLVESTLGVGTLMTVILPPVRATRGDKEAGKKNSSIAA